MGVVSKAVSAGYGMHHCRVMPPVYPKLGMRLARRSVMPSCVTAYDAGCDQSSPPKLPHWHPGYTFWGSRMIELHGYHMKNYETICRASWPQHRQRAKARDIVVGAMPMSAMNAMTAMQA